MNTKENKLDEVEDNKKNGRNKLSICVVLFSTFYYSEFFLGDENENII